MLRTSESESEILLGNKQLLGIFLVVAVLLGVAFTGGFVLGRGGAGKKTVPLETASVPKDDAGANQASSGGQTRTLEGQPDLPAAASGGADLEAAAPLPLTKPDSGEESPRAAEPALGSHKRTALSVPTVQAKAPAAEARTADTESGYAPHSGTQYLQVAAVGRDEAEAVADVLHKKGFHAHAVPKPGSVKLYRVIIGPVRDAGDLSSTRDALRKTGFREVIVQRY